MTCFNNFYMQNNEVDSNNAGDLTFAKALYEVHSQSRKNQVDAIKKAQQVKSGNPNIEDYINFPKANADKEKKEEFKAQIGKYIMYVACGFASKELGKHRLGSNKGVRQNFRHFSDGKFADDLEKLVKNEFFCLKGCTTSRNTTYNFFNVSKICWSRGRKETEFINEKLSELAREVVDYCRDVGKFNTGDIKKNTKKILETAMDCCTAISAECGKMGCKGLDFVPGYGWINPAWRLINGHGGRFFKKGVDNLFGKMGVKCCTWNSFSHDQSKYDQPFENLSSAAKQQTVSK